MKVPPMTPERQIEELRRLEREATPGTALIERREDDDGSIDWIVYGPTGDLAACFETANENARANAHFLCAARNALPSLLSALEDSRRMLEEERAKVRQLVELIDGDLEQAEAREAFLGEPCPAYPCEGCNRYVCSCEPTTKCSACGAPRETIDSSGLCVSCRVVKGALKEGTGQSPAKKAHVWQQFTDNCIACDANDNDASADEPCPWMRPNSPAPSLAGTADETAQERSGRRAEVVVNAWLRTCQEHTEELTLTDAQELELIESIEHELIVCDERARDIGAKAERERADQAVRSAKSIQRECNEALGKVMAERDAAEAKVAAWEPVIRKLLKATSLHDTPRLSQAMQALGETPAEFRPSAATEPSGNRDG